MLFKCLSIAGFDGSGGAGIQADLKTFSALGCYGMTVLTALPIQNTQGVRSCYTIPIKSIHEQIDAIFDDIVPNSIKIGMLYSSKIIRLIATLLKQYAKNIPIVLDPVMVSKSNDTLLCPNAIKALKQEIIPLATIVTPNMPEARALTKKYKRHSKNISDMDNARELAQEIMTMGPEAVLVKGGHEHEKDSKYSDDVYLDHKKVFTQLRSKRIPSKNTHGTGCTLSAAIAAYLARGFSLQEACIHAKRYLFHAIQAAQHSSIGQGNGPVHHFYHLWPTIEKIAQCNDNDDVILS